MSYEHLIITKHAWIRMLRREISLGEVRHILKAGKIIKEYPLDRPFPSYIISGYSDKGIVSVVASDDHSQKQTHIITTYRRKRKID